MPFWFALLLFSVSTVLGQLFRPKTSTPKPASLSEIDFPTAEETRAIGKGYGTFIMKAPNVVSVTDFSSEPIKSKVSALQKIMSFGLAKSQTTGYKYFCGIEMALCYRVDALTKIIVGDKVAWSGEVTTDSEIYINQPKLFGGDDPASSGNGGIVGYVGVHVGLPNASKDAYLVSEYGNYSAHRGICYAVLKGQHRAKGSGYVGNSTNIAAWQFVGRFIPNNLPYSSYFGASNYSNINTGDANPAEVLYDIIRSAEYAIGMPAQFVNIESFTRAAKVFYDDGLGFSAFWDTAKPCRELINQILQLTDSVLYSDLQTGELVLTPARADYDLEDLPEFTDADIISISSYTRGAWAETTNEVSIPFINRHADFIQQTAKAQDLANQRLQGATVAANVQHIGISNADTAADVAQRDLRAMTTPLAKSTFEVNLKGYKVVPGAPFKFTTKKITDHNGNYINQMVMRCNGTKIGTPRNPIIQIECIEDVFNSATAVISSPPVPGGSDPTTAPVATATYALDELPFMLASADAAAFLWAMAAAPNAGSYTFDMMTSGDNFTTYEADDDNNPFTPTGLLNAAYGSATAAVDNTGILVINATGSSNLDKLQAATAAEIANGSNLFLVIEGTKVEIMAFESYTLVSGNYQLNNVWRGLLDTVPQAFTNAARAWFFSYGDARGDNPFTSGATGYAKLLTRTLQGVLDMGSAATISRTMGVRALRPYAPGNITINGVYNGTIPASGDITIAWAHRDRTRQGTVIPQNNTAVPGIEGNGAFYTLKIYNQAGTLIKTVTNLFGTSYVYTNAAETADNGGSLADALTFMIYTTREGVTSLQAQIRGSARTGVTIYAPAYVPSGTYAPLPTGSSTTIGGTPITGTPTGTNNMPTYDPTTGTIIWQPVTLPDLSPSPAGVYGSATQVPQMTVDIKGRVTAVTPVTISGGGGSSGGASGIEAAQTTSMAQDEEFEGSALDAKWTKTGSAAVESYNDKIKSAYYARMNNGQAINLEQPYAPAGDFSLTLCASQELIEDFTLCSLGVNDVTGNNAVLLYYAFSGSPKVMLHKVVGGVITYEVYVAAVSAINYPIVILHLQRVAGVWGLYYSNGLQWQTLNAAHAQAVTVSRFNIYMGGGSVSSKKTSSAFHWIRRDWLYI